MKTKPERIMVFTGERTSNEIEKYRGYNNCYDEYEEFLPDVKEIVEMLYPFVLPFAPTDKEVKGLAQAIAKRIGKL